MNRAKTYLKIIQERFHAIKDLGDQTIAQLALEQLQWAFNEDSNSIAIIVKHMRGKMVSRWTDFLTTDGEKPTRNRDDEFIDNLTSKEELVSIWEHGWQVLFQALKQLTEADLLKYVTIRGEKHTVIEAIERQLAHYAMHVGQIVYVGKQMKGNQWTTLSIPKGQSQAYTEAKLKERK